MIISSLAEIKSPPLFYNLANFISNTTVYIKLEGLNIAGSIKLKSAQRMLEALDQTYKIQRGLTTVITSSSGNLGIALAILCKEKGLPFICVSDSNLLPISESYIKAYGGSVVKITTRDENGGFLLNRIRYIEDQVKHNPHLIYLDQYENQENINAHYLTTAQEIATQFPQLDYLFVGAGTTGTLGGCSQFFKRFFPKTKIIAVDTVGSITFGHPAGKRHIPGLGTSMKPKISEQAFFDDLIMVHEQDTVSQCRWLLESHGLFLGGSSGTVLQGVYEYQKLIPEHSLVVAIAPDFGDRYMHTIYNDAWVNDKNLGTQHHDC
jgi:cysteine synthase A